MSSVLSLRRFSFINYYISMAGGLCVLTYNILPETVTMQLKWGGGSSPIKKNHFGRGDKKNYGGEGSEKISLAQPVIWLLF